MPPGESRKADDLYRYFTVLRDEVHGPFRNACAEDLEFYELRFMESRPYLPEQLRRSTTGTSTPFHDVIPPTAYNGVESAADHILTTPRITVRPRTRTPGRSTEREIAERKQQFLNQWWTESLLTNGDRMAELAKHLILHGKGVLKVMLRGELLARSRQVARGGLRPRR